jgi:ParB family chromosome partitioning protein
MGNTSNEVAITPGQNPLLQEKQNTVTRRIPLSLLTEPPDPMRHDMEDERLVELAASIREVGLLQDLCVIPIDVHGERQKLTPNMTALVNHEESGGAYQVMVGHRRLLACRSINLESVTCKVFCDPATSEVAIMAHENSFREDPSDYDLAVMYSEWLKEPGLTEADLRRRAGKSLEFIYARAELLSGWQFVAMALHARSIPFTVARALNREEDEPYAKMFLNMAIDQGATGKLVSAWVTEHKAHKDMTPQSGPMPDVGAAVVVAQAVLPECIACGERQSYNLRTILLCAHCADTIRALRKQSEGGDDLPEVRP